MSLKFSFVGFVVASDAVPLLDISVEISGTLAVGQTLTAIVNNDPGGGTYQWYRNSVIIGGATASTYLLLSADQNKAIKVIYTHSATPYESIETPVIP